MSFYLSPACWRIQKLYISHFTKLHVWIYIWDDYPQWLHDVSFWGLNHQPCALSLRSDKRQPARWRRYQGGALDEPYLQRWPGFLPGALVPPVGPIPLIHHHVIFIFAMENGGGMPPPFPDRGCNLRNLGSRWSRWVVIDNGRGLWTCSHLAGPRNSISRHWPLASWSMVLENHAKHSWTTCLWSPARLNYRSVPGSPELASPFATQVETIYFFARLKKMTLWPSCRHWVAWEKQGTCRNSHQTHALQVAGDMDSKSRCNSTHAAFMHAIRILLKMADQSYKCFDEVPQPLQGRRTCSAFQFARSYSSSHSDSAGACITASKKVADHHGFRGRPRYGRLDLKRGNGWTWRTNPKNY